MPLKRHVTSNDPSIKQPQPSKACLIGISTRKSLFLAFLLTCLATPASPAVAAEAQNGQTVYMQSRCFVCHGESGGGTVGPSFLNDKFLVITDYVIAQILIGRGIMPSFALSLDDKQVAAVADHIRNSWGNHFGPVDPAEVAKVRKETAEPSPTLQ